VGIFWAGGTLCCRAAQASSHTLRLLPFVVGLMPRTQLLYQRIIHYYLHEKKLPPFICHPPYPANTCSPHLTSPCDFPATVRHFPTRDSLSSSMIHRHVSTAIHSPIHSSRRRRHPYLARAIAVYPYTPFPLAPRLPLRSLLLRVFKVAVIL